MHAERRDMTLQLTHPEPAARITVAAGASIADALAACLSTTASALDPAIPTVLLLPPPPLPSVVRAAARVLEHALASAVPAGVATVRPPAGLDRLRQVAGRWRERPVPPGGERFDTVLIPPLLADRQRVLLTLLPGAPNDSHSPFALLAACAHPRQQLAAKIARDSAAAAELGAPLAPALTVLVSNALDAPFAAATGDPIAAMLLWLAWLPDDPAAERVGPWEDAAVQRATQLDLGVRTPSALRLVNATPPASDHAIDPERLRQLRYRLGLDES
ncbi:MAG: hypothetical protein IT337_05535 [Thermomicrobiales bacterium]|nr:hypothetical protein [Thermomicrobiales bacterium]